jgi:hypothetical protein
VGGKDTGRPENPPAKPKRVIDKEVKKKNCWLI